MYSVVAPSKIPKGRTLNRILLGLSGLDFIHPRYKAHKAIYRRKNMIGDMMETVGDLLELIQGKGFFWKNCIV